MLFRSSEREVVAAEAERASIKYKMVEFMEEHIGEEFDGHISGLTDWGAYVELDETHIEGLAHMRDIEGDFFVFDETNYEIVGQSTGRRFTLGDAVRICVKQADLRKRQLDFLLKAAHSATDRGERGKHEEHEPRPYYDRDGRSKKRRRKEIDAGPVVRRSTRRKA